jgi:predicted nucleotidyltransferase
MMDQYEVKKIQSLINPIFDKNKVIKAFLFGSAARRTETRKSDLDLMIVMESDKRFFDRFEAFNEIFSLFKGKALDLLIYTPEELKKISDRPFIRSLLKEGRLIYEHREK